MVKIDKVHKVLTKIPVDQTVGASKPCTRCSKAKSLPKNRRVKLQPIMEHKPMGMVNYGLIGPMKECPEQYCYVLTMADQAARDCFAMPIWDGSAITPTKAINKLFILRSQT